MHQWEKVLQQIRQKIYCKNTMHHQDAFYRRSVLDDFHHRQSKSPGQAKRFLLSGDCQLNLRLFTRKAKCGYVDKIFCRCGKGISTEGRFIGDQEGIRIRYLYMDFAKTVLRGIVTLYRCGRNSGGSMKEISISVSRLWERLLEE